MKQNILDYLNKCEGLKTSIKNLHWSASNMSEHKLFDDIASSVSDIQDTIAEIAQGLYGKIGKNELKPISYSIESSKQFLEELLTSSKDFYATLNEDDTDLIGVRSEMETFIGKVSQFQYLLDLCLKEDFKRNFKNKINENKRQITITESQIRRIIENAALEIIKENKKRGIF